ncbi:hypothetical protein [Phaeobacter phage MD18]|nr:hypothetical protein [Phaeobacter phage MD18]
MTQHDARTFENGTPAESASDARPGTLYQRLDAVEQSIAMVNEISKGLLSGFQKHQAILTQLIAVPTTLHGAMTSIAEDQNKANLTMMLKLDQHSSLIEELQEEIDDLRGEDDGDTKDHVVFNIETQTAAPGDFANSANTLTYATIAPDGTPVFGTLDASKVDADVIQKIMEAANGMGGEKEPDAEASPEPAPAPEPSTDLVRVEGEFLVITMPKVPAAGDLDENDAFDNHMGNVLQELRDQGIIRGDVADTLTAGIAGTVTPEKAASILPKGDPCAGLMEALLKWWEVEETAQLGVHVGHDLNLAVSHIVAFACLQVSMRNIMAALTVAS